MSRLSDFLINEYAPHFGVVRKTATINLITEIPAAVRFEIEDKKPTIQQPVGQGVSVIRRHNSTVEIIDIEDFTKTVHGTDHTPNSCDFAISPEIGTDFILFNELTKTKSGYIFPFKQPLTGEKQIGKLEYAKKQQIQTICRFYEVSDFCDQYAVKTALFSCRLSDKSGNGIMARSAKSFNKTIYKLQHLTLHEKLPHGFVFKMRIYKEEYSLP